MDQKKIRRPIKAFINSLKADIAVDRVILFGSVAGRKNRIDSDIDVLVVSKDFKRFSEDRRLTLLYDRSRFIKPEIHPWGITPEELAAASRLTTIGSARDHGITFLT